MAGGERERDSLMMAVFQSEKRLVKGKVKDAVPAPVVSGMWAWPLNSTV